MAPTTAILIKRRQGTNKDSGWNARVAPRLIATGTDGAIHSTTLFAVGDFQFFNDNTVSADAGLSHNYNPTQDLALNFNARYTRETSLFTALSTSTTTRLGRVARRRLPSRLSSILSAQAPASIQSPLISLRPVHRRQNNSARALQAYQGPLFISLTTMATTIQRRLVRRTMGPAFGYREGLVTISCRGSMPSAKWTESGSVTTIQYSTQTDTGSSAVLEPMTKTV